LCTSAYLVSLAVICPLFVDVM